MLRPLILSPERFSIRDRRKPFPRRRRDKQGEDGEGGGEKEEKGMEKKCFTYYRVVKPKFMYKNLKEKLKNHSRRLNDLDNVSA